MLEEQSLGRREWAWEGREAFWGAAACRTSCFWCHPCPEHCSTDLAASSCLPPGCQHPSAPAELLPVCFSSALGREKPNHATCEGAGPLHRNDLAHFYNPCGWRRPELKGFFGLSAQGLLATSTECDPNHTPKQPMFSPSVLLGHWLHADTFIFLYLCISVTYSGLPRLLSCGTNPLFAWAWPWQGEENQPHPAAVLECSFGDKTAVPVSFLNLTETNITPRHWTPHTWL